MPCIKNNCKDKSYLCSSFWYMTFIKNIGKHWGGGRGGGGRDCSPSLRPRYFFPVQRWKLEKQKWGLMNWDGRQCILWRALAVTSAPQWGRWGHDDGVRQEFQWAQPSSSHHKTLIPTLLDIFSWKHHFHIIITATTLIMVEILGTWWRKCNRNSDEQHCSTNSNYHYFNSQLGHKNQLKRMFFSLVFCSRDFFRCLDKFINLASLKVIHLLGFSYNFQISGIKLHFFSG